MPLSGDTQQGRKPTSRAATLRDSLAELADLLGTSADTPFHGIVARSTAMQQVVHQAKRFAASAATVLLTGESGSGKEVVARMVHLWSRRANHPYVRINCAALAESLMESELFGHERGAFTGAEQHRMGRLEYAGEGTVLLDEISEIPCGLQAKLLRVLEEEEFQRVGSNETRHFRARVLATSNRDLQKEVQQGRFRADLYYRLNVLQIHIPPLRQRPDDVGPLAEYFFAKHRDEAPHALKGISSQAMDRLQQYSWPGNVRELRNVVRRACIVSQTEYIMEDDLALSSPPCSEIPPELADLPLADVERRLIVANLRRFNGNKARTAASLGVTSRTLANKVKRYRELGYL